MPDGAHQLLIKTILVGTTKNMVVKERMRIVASGEMELQLPLQASPHGDQSTDYKYVKNIFIFPYFRDSNDKEGRRSWSSSTNLAPVQDKRSSLPNNTDFGNPSSWTSTPDLANLEDDTQANIPTVSLTLPKRKQKPFDATSRTGTVFKSSNN